MAVPPGMPNAHFSVSLGTLRVVSPAAAAGWNRALVGSFPHPFHRGSFDGSGSAAGWVAQRPSVGSAGGDAIGDRKAAIAAFSTAVMPVAIGAIDPPVESAATMASRLRSRRAAREGARVASGDPASASWHEAQRAR